jgi:hypothetical protein
MIDSQVLTKNETMGTTVQPSAMQWITPPVPVPVQTPSPAPVQPKKQSPKFVEYCLNFWDWEKSEYIKDKLDCGGQIGKSWCKQCRNTIINYIVPYFSPELRVDELTIEQLETFKSSLPRDRITNATANSVRKAISKPLNELKRIGIITFNPVEGVRKYMKGI